MRYLPSVVVRVLIVDDEPDIRMLYRLAFEQAGTDVEEAADGEEAMAVAARSQPSIIVLDLLMPGTDGLSALPQLRRLLPDAPIVIVSAHASVEILARCRALGANACFYKTDFLRRIPDVVARYDTTA